VIAPDEFGGDMKAHCIELKIICLIISGTSSDYNSYVDIIATHLSRMI